MTSPTDVEDLQQLVRNAAENERPIALVGNGGRSFLGRGDVQGDTVELAGLDELVSYEPAELILVAQPGMKLATIEQVLAEHGQHLAFEPPHWSHSATLGGTIACGLSGPRRFKVGAARDFVLGVEFVNGHGDRVKAGGRVVKNVTGYDLPRTLTGSYGTLGVLTEICLKLWPRPESERTVSIPGQTLDKAVETMIGWARLAVEITGLAYIPTNSGTVTVARIEGSEKAAAKQAEQLMQPMREAELLTAQASRQLWKDIREMRPFGPESKEELWRFSIPQSEAVMLARLLQSQGLSRYALDGGGAVFWAVMPSVADAEALHETARRCHGGAWRFATGPDDENARAFTPLAPNLLKANVALKKALDPKSILNRGRMYSEL